MPMCRVTTFVVATEDAGKGCQITQVKGPAPEVFAYEKRVSCSPPPFWHLEPITLQSTDTLSLLLEFVVVDKQVVQHCFCSFWPGLKGCLAYKASRRLSSSQCTFTNLSMQRLSSV